MEEEQKELKRVGADGVVPEEAEQPSAAQAETDSKDAAKPAENKDPQDHKRRTVLYGAAGAYLIYLAVQMLREVFGEKPIVWSGSHIAAVIASVLFIAFGVLLIVRIAIWYKQDMEKKNQTDDQQGET